MVAKKLFTDVWIGVLISETITIKHFVYPLSKKWCENNSFKIFNVNNKQQESWVPAWALVTPELEVIWTFLFLPSISHRSVIEHHLHIERPNLSTPGSRIAICYFSKRRRRRKSLQFATPKTSQNVNDALPSKVFHPSQGGEWQKSSNEVSFPILLKLSFKFKCGWSSFTFTRILQK